MPTDINWHPARIKAMGAGCTFIILGFSGVESHHQLASKLNIRFILAPLALHSGSTSTLSALVPFSPQLRQH